MGGDRRITDALAAFPAPASGPAPPHEKALSMKGPGVWLRRNCEVFDALLSLDHKAARAADEKYDEAFHSAVHALKDLRQFADVLAPTWTEAARRFASTSGPAPSKGDVGLRGRFDTILRLLEQEEISRAKARELLHTGEWPDDAVLARLNWHDASGPAPAPTMEALSVYMTCEECGHEQNEDVLLAPCARCVATPGPAPASTREKVEEQIVLAYKYGRKQAGINLTEAVDMMFAIFSVTPAPADRTAGGENG